MMLGIIASTRVTFPGTPSSHLMQAPNKIRQIQLILRDCNVVRSLQMESTGAWLHGLELGVDLLERREFMIVCWIIS